MRLGMRTRFLFWVLVVHFAFLPHYPVFSLLVRDEFCCNASMSYQAFLFPFRISASTFFCWPHFFPIGCHRACLHYNLKWPQRLNFCNVADVAKSLEEFFGKVTWDFSRMTQMKPNAYQHYPSALHALNAIYCSTGTFTFGAPWKCENVETCGNMWSFKLRSPTWFAAKLHEWFMRATDANKAVPCIDGQAPWCHGVSKDLLGLFSQVCSTLFNPLEVGPGITVRNSCQNDSNVALRSCSKDIWLTSARARAMAALHDASKWTTGPSEKNLREWRLQPAHRFLVPWP